MPRIKKAHQPTTIPTEEKKPTLTDQQKKVLDTALDCFTKHDTQCWTKLKGLNLSQGQERLSVCQKLIRTVYETVLGEFKTPIHVEEGMQWLISNDSEHASFYKGVLARFLFAQNKLDDCVKVLKEQITNIDTKDEKLIKTYTDKKNYVKLIAIYQKYLPAESHVDPEAQRKYEREMLDLLSRILPSQKDEKLENQDETTETPLKKTDVKELENFLAYSIGNSEFNRRLHLKSNRTPAENFVWSLSHITSSEVSGTAGINTLSNAVQVTKEKLGETNLKTLWESYSQIEYLELDILNARSSIQSDKGNDFIDIISTRGKNIWEIRKSPEYLNFLIDLKPKNTANKNLVNSLIKEINTTNDLEKKLSTQGIKLPYSTLKQLEMFNSLHTNLARIAQRCHNFSNNPILHEIYQGATSANETLDQLKMMMNSSSNYRAGDVLIRDEKRYKKYSGGKRTIYSEMSLWMNIKGAFQIAIDAITKGVWSVQPYFTGSRMHARVVYNATHDINTETDTYMAATKPLAADITLQGYDESNITPGDTMEEIALRPDFSKILSDTGKASLKDKNPSPEEYVRLIFAEKLSDDISSKQTENKNLILNEMRGFKAYVLSTVPAKIKSICLGIFNFFFGRNGIVRPLINLVVANARGKKDTETLIVKEENKRICSEFVSDTLRNALDRTQKQLRKNLGKDENDTTISFFNDVFPSDLPSEEIHPNYLEQLLIKNGYFTEIKRPPILQHIFKGVEEDLEKAKQT